MTIFLIKFCLIHMHTLKTTQRLNPLYPTTDYGAKSSSLEEMIHRI